MTHPTLEDRYETRLRALIDAKLKGEGIEAADGLQIATSNVVDLMAALKKSLGQAPEETPERAPRKKAPKAASGSCSGCEQAFTQAGLISLFHPAMEAKEAAVFLETHDAIDLGLGHGTVS